MTGALRRHRWWLVRTLVLPVHVLAFAVFSFFLVRLVPGDPVMSILDPSQPITQADYDRAAASLGLDGSLWEQLLRFLGNLAQLDLGTSAVTGRGIWTEVLTRLPSTMELVLLGLGGSVALTVLLGFLTLRFSHPVLQASTRGYAKLAGAIPSFALAILGLVLFYAVWRVVPAPIGRVDPGMSIPHTTGFPIVDSVLGGRWDVLASLAGHLVLPVLVMVVVYTPTVWKQFLLGIDEAADAPATLFRISSGARRSAVYGSIFRRAAAGSVVMVGSLYGGLVGSVVVLERLFGFGGIGQFAIDAVDTVDFLALQGFLIVIAAVCLTAFFLVDVVNMLLDPRRRPGVRADD